jgi:hypothetical protein
LNALYDDDSDDVHAAPSSSWNAEGENCPEISAQMVQHLRALKFLKNQNANPLTIDVVLKTHDIFDAWSSGRQWQVYQKWQVA